MPSIILSDADVNCCETVRQNLNGMPSCLGKKMLKLKRD